MAKSGKVRNHDLPSQASVPSTSVFLIHILYPTVCCVLQLLVCVPENQVAPSAGWEKTLQLILCSLRECSLFGLGHQRPLIGVFAGIGRGVCCEHRGRRWLSLSTVISQTRKCPPLLFCISDIAQIYLCEPSTDGKVFF